MREYRTLASAGLFLVALALPSVPALAVEAGKKTADVAGRSVSKYEAYKALAARHGVKPRSDRPLVIGLRGRDLAGKAHPVRIRPGYRDTLVILTTDQRTIELPLSTHPWQTEAPGIPDVDGDGIVDVGMILEGRYLAIRRSVRRNIAGAPTYHLLTPKGSGRLPGIRNTDQDDRFSAAERRASKRRGDKLTAVLFHQEGGEGDPRPVGCQILDAEGMRVLAEEVGERFDYWLFDANEAPTGQGEQE